MYVLTDDNLNVLASPRFFGMREAIDHAEAMLRDGISRPSIYVWSNDTNMTTVFYQDLPEFRLLYNYGALVNASAYIAMMDLAEAHLKIPLIKDSPEDVQLQSLGRKLLKFYGGQPNYKFVGIENLDGYTQFTRIKREDEMYVAIPFYENVFYPKVRG